MPEAVVLSAVRTPVGRYGGALAGVRPDDLAALAIAAAVERAGVPAGEIEDVFLGCANQAGEDNRNVARMAALLAGHPRSDTTLERLAALRPAFRRDGTVTVGNASGLNDGAAAVVVASAARAASLGARPLGRYVAGAVAGVHPSVMGIGPIPAARRALARA